MGKFSEFKIPLKTFKPGETTMEFHLGHQFFINMENTDIHDANLDVKATVDYRGDIYNITFEVHGTVTLLCDRCLDKLEWPVDATYSIAVEYGTDYNDESDRLLIIPESDNYLNVAYMLYDTVVLTIPMRHVHPLGKCNRAMSSILKKHNAGGHADDSDREMMEGLIDEMEDADAGGGQNTPTDPRWDALSGLNTDPE